MEKPEDLGVPAEQLHLPANVNLARLEVDVVGGEGEDLALSQTESRAEPGDELIPLRQRLH